MAEVASIGGFVRQYQIDVDPNRLAAYGLTIRDVVEAVQMSNNNVGGKVLEKGGLEYIVRGLGLIHDVSDVEKIVVTARGGTPVYISNLGTVAARPGVPARRAREGRPGGRRRRRDDALRRERAGDHRARQGEARRGLAGACRPASRSCRSTTGRP